MLFLSVGAQLRRDQINRKAGVQLDPDSIQKYLLGLNRVSFSLVLESGPFALAGNCFGGVLFAIC